jgi:hypothetical protein
MPATRRTIIAGMAGLSLFGGALWRARNFSRAAVLYWLEGGMSSSIKRGYMRQMIWGIAFAATLAAPGLTHAKGCLKGAAVGGVVGHVAGHHAVAGAAVGCLVGHHQAKRQEQAARAAEAAQARPAPSSGGAPNP